MGAAILAKDEDKVMDINTLLSKLETIEDVMVSNKNTLDLYLKMIMKKINLGIVIILIKLEKTILKVTSEMYI